MTKPYTPEWAYRVQQNYPMPEAYSIICESSDWGSGMRALVPVHMWIPTFDYVVYGKIHGRFLMALFCNHLMETYRHGDDINRECIGDWVKFIWNYTPPGCHGSPDAVDEWGKMGGLLGLKRQAQERTEGAT